MVFCSSNKIKIKNDTNRRVFALRSKFRIPRQSQVGLPEGRVCVCVCGESDENRCNSVVYFLFLHSESCLTTSSRLGNTAATITWLNTFSGNTLNTFILKRL